MLASRSKVVAFVAIGFYFLIQESQTETSRFRKMLILQHLKRSRRRMVLLQIALKNTRRARRAWAWPRNQFWFESLLQGDFVEDWWKENFRMSRRSNRSLTSLLSAMIEMLGRKRDNRTICSPRDVTYRHKRIYLSSWPWLPTVTMPDHRVITTFTLVKFLLSFAAFTKVSVSVYTRKMFT